MKELIVLAFNAFLVQNIILTQFLGICSFLGVSNKRSSAIGMGMAVLFVITFSSMAVWAIYYGLLYPDFTFMRTIVFILVIASMVQVLEMFMKKFFPPLYKALGVYLPLITTNCTVLGVAILNIDKNFGFAEMVTFSIFTSMGYTVVIILFSYIRESIQKAPIPEGFKGIPVALIMASIMSLIFKGFVGMI
jgi:electron transport complex protein RnfA